VDRSAELVGSSIHHEIAVIFSGVLLVFVPHQRLTHLRYYEVSRAVLLAKALGENRFLHRWTPPSELLNVVRYTKTIIIEARVFIYIEGRSLRSCHPHVPSFGDFQTLL
jgi:hypothetical protein